MVDPVVWDIGYLVSASLFILGIKKLSSPKTAPDGNRLGALGMLLAVLVTLAKLRDAGYKLAILSNGDRDMLDAAKPHIGFPFDHVISVEESGYFKPHWKTYASAAEIIGADRSSCLFVANHAFDCIGAKCYGMRTAFIDRRKRPFGETPHQPDIIVGGFTELAVALTGG